MAKPLHIRAGQPLMAGVHRHAVWGAHRVRRSGGTDDWQLIATIAGEGRVEPGIAATTATLVLIPPGLANDYVAAPGRPWDYAWVHFPAAARIANLLAWSGPGPHPLAVPESAAAAMAARIREIAVILATPQRRRIERAENALEDVLLHADAWNPQAGPPPDAAIARVLAALSATPERRWRLDGLARLAGLSRAQFTRRFRQATGSSPQRHLENLRLDQALRQLRDAGATVEATALRLGFCSPGHFSERFLRRFGERPGHASRRR